MSCCSSCYKSTRWVVPQEDQMQLRTTTNLTNGQIQHLYERFCFIADKGVSAPPKHLLKRNFLSVAKLPSNPLMSTILSSMFGDKKVLKFVDFATYLSIFVANTLKTTKEQIDSAKKKKYRLLFNMYDSDKDGRITQDDLIKIMHKMYSDVMHKEKILHYVAVIMSEMDTSHTNQILFNDFCNSLAPFDMDETLVTFIPEA